MRMQVEEVVRGFQNMTYTIDGKEVQTKVIFIDVNLNQDAGGKGTRTRDIKCISAEVIKAVEHNPFPLLCKLDIEELATKNKTELFVQSITPLKQVGPAQPPASVKQ
ncbi:unnamed protein product [marine sediment metagenome]|uniref:Uncharacterized protein n=1 Tax=marine sediment metagenome TaxID=412755 RepID=X1KPD3_9ZZZZ